MKKGKYSIKIFWPALWILTILLLAMPAVAALKVPEPTEMFFVYDEMGVLSQSTQDEILKTNIELQAKTKAQVVVATVRDLQGYPVEDYALNMFREWGIGDRELNNGVLILLGYQPETDRYHVFISIGYGLEGQLNDGKVGRILDEYFMPIIDRDDPESFDEALREVFRGVISQVIAEYDVELTGDYDQYIKALEASEDEDDEWVVGLIVVILILLIMFGRYNQGGGGGGSGTYTSYGGFSGGSSGGFGGFSGGGGSTGGGGAGRSF